MAEQNVPIQRMTIIRTLLLFIAWFNQFLSMNGYSPLPFSDQELELGVSMLVTFVVSIWTWWKNNDITQKARSRTKYLKEQGKM